MHSSRLRWLGLAGAYLFGSQGMPGCTCDKEAPGAPTLNHPPVASAGADVQALTLSSVTLDGTASFDPDGDTITFAWTQTEGEAVVLSDATAPMPTFVAPAAPTTVAFSLAVSDGDLAASDLVRIVVVDTITNGPPLADAGVDRQVGANTQVVLDGTGSSDPNGDALTFSWTQLQGPTAALAGADTAQPSFVAPSVTEATLLIFSLTVNDGQLDSAPDSVSITVTPGGPPNQAPTAAAGPDQTVDMLASVTLDGSGSSDPENDPLTFHWAQTSGPAVTLSDDTAASPTFTAPVVLADSAVTFSLVVNDGAQDSLPDSVTINIHHVNRPPVVVSILPAAPHSVNEGETLTIDVTFDDPDGDILAISENCDDYGFVSCVVVGDVVTVELSPGSADGNSTVALTLTADDGLGGTVDAELSVAIVDVNMPPEAEVSPAGPHDVTEGATYTITVTFTDPDGDAFTIDLGNCEPVTWINCTDNGDGSVTLIVTPPLDAGGDTAFPVVFATDTGTHLTGELIPITVLDLAPPQVTFAGRNHPPFHVVDAGDTDTAVTVVVTDAPDNDTPYTCVLTGAPSYVTLDNSLVLTLTPSSTDADGDVSVTCSDADGGIGSGTFGVRVNHAPQAAFSWSPDPVPAGANVPLVDATTDDPWDTHTCTWSISGGGIITGDASNCDGAGILIAECSASATVTLTVEDGRGLGDSESHVIAASGVGPHVQKRADCTGACGSRLAPWCTLQEAIAAAAGGTSFTEVYVAPSTIAATYNDAADGALQLVSHVSVLGGYDAAAWDDPPDRVAHRTEIAVSRSVGIELDSLTDVVFAGFYVTSAVGLTAPPAVKACLTVTDGDETVVIRDNDINATLNGGVPPSETVAVDLFGSVGGVLRANRINGGNGVASATGVRYRPDALGTPFAGVIEDHLEDDGNGITGGNSADVAGLRFLGPLGANASITNNDILGGTASGTAWGILFADQCEMTLTGNHSIIGGGRTTANGIGVEFSDVAQSGSVHVADERLVLGGSDAIAGTGIVLRGAGAALIERVAAYGVDRSVAAPWSGRGEGLVADGDVELEVYSSVLVGGEVATGIGVDYQITDGAPGLRIGGSAAGLSNIISGAMLDPAGGGAAAGGTSFIGLRLSTAGGAFSTLAHIEGNLVILGGAPNAAGPGGAPGLARGIVLEEVGNVLIAGNQAIIGCAPGCRGTAPSTNPQTPYGAGIEISGAAVLADPAASGALLDNDVIAGGAVLAASNPSQPVVAGLWLHGSNTGAPRVLARGNSLYGNPGFSGAGTGYADGALVQFGTLLLGDATAGNPLVMGGYSTQQSSGARIDARGNAELHVENNTLVIGFPGGDVASPARAYGVRGESGSATSPNVLVVRDNLQSPLTSDQGGIVGGAASVEAAGISVWRMAGGPIADNSIAGGVIVGVGSGTSMPITLGLDLSANTERVVIENNLIEACGVYGGTSGTQHHALCLAADQSRGARLNSGVGLDLWNNRIFGGYATPPAPMVGVNAVALELFDPFASVDPSPAVVVAHNLLVAQGAPSVALPSAQVAAVLLSGPNGVAGNGNGLFLINNILDNGALASVRYHVYERALNDIDELVFSHNVFVPDADNDTVIYHEEATPDPDPTESWYADTIGVGCTTSPHCLDDADGATAQSVHGQSNYDGDLVVDPGFAVSLAVLREIPRLQPLSSFYVSADVLLGAGYDFAGGDPFGLVGPTLDFEGDARGAPPDIGHDER